MISSSSNLSCMIVPVLIIGIAACLWIFGQRSSQVSSVSEEENYVLAMVGGRYPIDNSILDHALFLVEEVDEEQEFYWGKIIVSVPSDAEDVRIQRFLYEDCVSESDFVISYRIGNETQTLTWSYDPYAPIEEAPLLNGWPISIDEIVVRAEL
jgi:hypothetical protein